MFIDRFSLVSNASSRACHSGLKGRTSADRAFVVARYAPAEVLSGRRCIPALCAVLVRCDGVTSACRLIAQSGSSFGGEIAVTQPASGTLSTTAAAIPTARIARTPLPKLASFAILHSAGSLPQENSLHRRASNRAARRATLR